ncbi:hypothetical protein GH714_020674 [Hevea brasiliensis]|uniref:Uncharacterized protein n=1 Tax=Hevea brasiliensis TaxID=3981 RepID=A0A6A6LUE2_HEVBR|nr:hypothetical protein GH714_020674 [Hevea brasiliensis]
MAESMSDFVASRTKLYVGPIHRPPILSRNQLGFLFAVLLIWTPFMVKKVLTGQTLLHDPKIWLGGAGSGMQLGAEGFAIGFLYTIVGLLLAFVTHVLVMVKNVTVQRSIMVVSLVVSFWAVNKVIYLDNWKTGYGVHTFWPSSWK